jgi:hypothetical protein
MTYSATQIVDQILWIFNADAQPDNVLGHVAFPPRLFVDAGMAHAARHANQTVHAAEADTNGPESCALDDTLADGDVAGLERQHGAGAACPAPVEIVLRVGPGSGL